MAVREHHRTQSPSRRVSPPRPGRRALPRHGARQGGGRHRVRPIRCGPPSGAWSRTGEAAWTGASRPSRRPPRQHRPACSPTSCSKTAGRTGTTQIETRRDPLRRHQRRRQALLLESGSPTLSAGSTRQIRWPPASSRIPRRASALGRRARMRRQDEADTRCSSSPRWRRQWREFLILPVPAARVRAGGIEARLARHGRRPARRGHGHADAGASSSRLRPTSSFAAFDRRLLEAAEREGFATLGGPLDVAAARAPRESGGAVARPRRRASHGTSAPSV